jgi:hypothetical protein
MSRIHSRTARIAAAAIVLLALATAFVPVGAVAQPTIDCQRLLPGADLSKCDLRGLDLSGLDLSGADLSKAVLDGADFSNALLVGADLTKASVVGVSFFHANLREAIVTKADFTSSIFENADIIDIVGGDSADFDNVVCVDGSPVVNGTCPPPPPSVLDVRVVDTAANPLTGILVELREVGDLDGDGTPDELVGIECTADGEADFSAIADGTYLVTATDAGPDCAANELYETTDTTVQYSAFGDTADGVLDDDVSGSGVFVGGPDAFVQLTPFATDGVIDVFVHGTDVDEGLTGILVTLESEAGDMFQWDCTVNGEVEFFVPDGTYTIIATDSATDPVYACGKDEEYETVTVVIDYTVAGDLAGDGDIDDDVAITGVGADLSLPLDPIPALGTLDVAVADEGTGAPLSNMVAKLYDEDGVFIDLECSFDGEAQFDNVPTGSYFVLVASSDGDDNCGAVVEYEAQQVSVVYSIAGDIAEDGALNDDVVAWFATGTGAAGEPDVIVIMEQIVQLDVLVTDEDGAPLADILVLVFDEDSALLATDCTNQAGVAHLPMPSGSYLVEATDSASPAVYSCGMVGLYETTVTSVVYSVDDDTGAPDATLVMALTELGSLTVFVQDSLADVELSGVWVELYDASGTTLLDRDCSAGGQSYFVVPSGTYILRTANGSAADGCVPPNGQLYEAEEQVLVYDVIEDVDQDGALFDDPSTGVGTPDANFPLVPLP